MNKIILFITSLIIPLTIHAQQFTWAVNDTAAYGTSPGYGKSCVTYYPGHVAHTYLTKLSLLQFGGAIGTYTMSVHNNQGQQLFTYTFGNNAIIQHIKASANGNIIVSGEFRDTLFINGTDTLFNHIFN